MSEIGLRVRQLRKENNLSQAEFAAKIGLKQTVVWSYEKGTRRVTDRTIADICRVFRVREEWLRNGIEPKMQQVASNFYADLGLDEDDKIIINTYLALPKEKRKIFKEYIYQVAEQVVMLRGLKQLHQERTPDHKMTTAEKRELINAELDGEEKGTISSASTLLNGSDFAN